MKHILSAYNELEYMNYKDQIKSLPGNMIIRIDLGGQQITMRSTTLKQWVFNQIFDGMEFEFINFMLNYLETQFKSDNSYHLKFQIGFYELIPQNIDSYMQYQQQLTAGYRYKNIKDNYKIHKQFDQLIIVATYRGMYFLYVIWLSRKKCHILDPQTQPQSRMNDHILVVQQLMALYQLTQSVECILLKEVKQNASMFIRAGLILDFLYRYIDDSHEVYRIEQLKIGQSQAVKLYDMITWYTYKCLKEDINLAQQIQQLPKYNDKQVDYSDWSEENRQNKPKPQGIQNKQQNHTKIVEESQKSSSMFSRIANSQILPAEQSHSQDEQITIKQRQQQQQSRSEIDAHDFMRRMELNKIPKSSLKDEGRNIQQNDDSKVIVTKSELNDILSEVKKQIKNDLMLEMVSQQEQWLNEQEYKLQTQTNKMDAQIAEEYLIQVRFQRYKEYMEYLLQYYYNNDQLEYDRLLKEYHERMKETALNGLVETQKAEMIKLQGLTKERMQQQNQQLEIALFNQQKQFDKLYPSKRKHQQLLQEELPKQIPKAGEYKYQFASPNELNPYEFKSEQVVNHYTKKSYSNLEIDLSNTQIEDIKKAWFLNESSSQSQSQASNGFDDELERLKQIYDNKSKKQISDSHQSIQSQLQLLNIPSEQSIAKGNDESYHSKLKSQQQVNIKSFKSIPASQSKINSYHSIPLSQHSIILKQEQARSMDGYNTPRQGTYGKSKFQPN